MVGKYYEGEKNMHILSKVKSQWDFETYKAYFSNYNDWNAAKRQKSAEAIYALWHPASSNYSTLNASVVMAIRCYVGALAKNSGSNPFASLVEIAGYEASGGKWVSEMKMKSGKYCIVEYVGSSGNLAGCIKSKNVSRLDSIDTLEAQAAVDMVAFYLVLIPKLISIATDLQDDFDAIAAADSIASVTHYARICDAMYYALEKTATDPQFEFHVVNILDGNIPSMTPIELDALSGVCLAGKPQIIGVSTKAVQKKVVLADAKKLFEDYVKTLHWTAEEERLIPQFPDDFIVPEETLCMCNAYIQTKNNRNPFVNFMFRGSTSYGKSTSVELMGAILHTPVLKQNCHPDMAIHNFMSDFVPATESESKTLTELPSFQEIAYDPVSTYEAITGKQNLTATPSDCMKALEKVRLVSAINVEEEIAKIQEEHTAALKAAGEKLITAMDAAKDTEALNEAKTNFNVDVKVADEVQSKSLTSLLEKTAKAKNENTEPSFKHVISNYLKALINGYICEVPELSRIRDSGVAAGLNEFARPGSIIPMLDGTIATRHPNAIVVFTDNVGYVSCRPVDPSVIRRSAFVIDRDKLSAENVLERVSYNTGIKDKVMLGKFYAVWEKIGEYCEQHDITEGSVSVTELENWVTMVNIEGMTMDSIRRNCLNCVVSKATADREDQQSIINAVLELELPKLA